MKKRLLIIVLLGLFLFLFCGQAWAGTWETKQLWATSSSYYVNALTTAPDGSIWAGGVANDYGRTARWNGSAWDDAGEPLSGSDVNAIITASDGSIWVAGGGGRTARRNGSAWEDKGIAFGNYTIYAMTIAPDGSIWVVGGYGRTARWNGSAWEYKGLWPAGSSYDIYAATTASDGSIWIAGENGYTARWNGSAWESKGTPLPDNIYALTAAPDGSIWAGGYHTYTARWNGSSWESKGQIISGTSIKDTDALTVTPDGSIWASANNDTYRWNGSSWIFMGTVGSSVNALTVAPNGNIWAGGSMGGAYRWNGAITLSINSATYNSITLNVGYDGNALSNTKLQRSTDNVNFTDVATISGTSYTVSGLSSATRYYFRIVTWRDYYNFWVLASPSISCLTTPQAPVVPTGTTYGVSWSNDPNNPGRGGVVVNWTPVTGATGYRIYLYDGYAYRMVQDVGNVTSWDSRVAKIFPAESVLNAITDNTSTTNFFVAPTTGYDLPDRPSKLYRKTSGTGNDSAINYWIKVSAYNSAGESPQSGAYTPTLPDRTDTVAPTGSMIINDGAYNTANRDVRIAISGNDDKSGVYQMQFSLDNISWTPWEPFSTTKNYQIGTSSNQTVYLKIKDNAGNVSNLISQSITFINDTEPPVITIKVNNGATQTFTNSVEITITAQDNLTTPENLKIRASLNGSTWYIYDEGSKSWSSSTGWSSYAANTQNFNLGSTGGQKHIYVQVKDPSGNVGNSTATIFYVTDAVKPGTTTTQPIANTSWGSNLNGKYVTVDGKVMMVVQGGSVTVSLTGISNSTELLTSFDGINWSQPDVIPSGVSSVNKDVSFNNEGKKAIFVKLVNDYSVESPIMARYYLVDNTAPTIEVKTASGATLTSGSSINLLIKAKDNVSTVLAYRINGGAWTQIPTNGIVSSGSLSSGRNQLNVEVIDQAGNTAQEVVNVWKN